MARHIVFGVLAALACGFTAPALAQQTTAPDLSAAPVEDAILVLDASGSMWARIDGVARTVIARDVILDLLDDLPPNRRLGLVAYGHNRKGDCSDIETLVEVGTDRDAIRQAIEGINPKGKTPMTAAVKQAAEALKYSENKATVILVSDGLETCGLDPCAVAKTLEKTGVGLTVHTVGFGLGDGEDEAKAQLRCMADNTGGRFLLAGDAEELAEALQQVGIAAPPQAEKVEVELLATDQDGGPVIRDGLIWTVRHGATGEVLFESPRGAGVVTAEIPRGVHEVSVERVADGAGASASLETGANGTRLTVPIVVELQASVEAPATAPAGSELRVTWTGPDEPGDYIAIAEPGSDGRAHINHTSVGEGNPLIVDLPDAPGTYEVRYISRKTRDVLARQAIEATPVQATLDVPATAAAGSTVQVAWSGPDYDNDYIAVAEPDGDDGAYVNYTHTRDGSPLELKLPDEPGTYEVQYVLRQSRDVLARQSIEVTPVQATLDVPATAAAGSTIQVAWSGPDYDNDYIAVAEPDGDDGAYVNYTHTRDGSPLELKLPDEPGTYEVQYVLRQSRNVLARETIEATPVRATLDAPATAMPGSTIQVAWSGPDYHNDYIAIAEAGAKGSSHVGYTHTSAGTPLELEVPDEPGSYEVRYILRQSRNILAREPIEVRGSAGD